MYKPIFQKREVFVFHRWGRRGYSVFASLGREVVISVLSVTMVQSIKSATVSDELFRADTTQTVKEVWLADVGVTGSRAPLAQSQAARMVTVLTRDDIQGAPVQSINDLLKMAVGVDVRQRGALGSQTDITVRGGTQEQVAVLLNGINVCDPQTGHNVMDLPCQIDDIVRIDVLEGPAGRAYGTSSLVGAINIVTRTDEQTSADARLEGGSYGYAAASARATLASGSWRHHASGGYSRSDGYSRALSGSRNTDYSGSKAFYQGGYYADNARVTWQLGLADKGWGSSTFYASPRWQADDQYEHTTKISAALQAEMRQGRLHIKPAVYWQQHRDRYEGYRDRPDLLKFNYNRTEVMGLSLNSYVDWTLGRTALGAELRNEDLVSGNLGEPLSRPRHIHGTDRQYTLGLNRTNISAHLEHNVVLRQLTVSAGLVAVKNTQSDMHMTLYPGVDASLRLSQQWRLYASYNTSLRMPTFTELYYKLQGYSADTHLKPEEMQAVEIGAQLEGRVLSGKAALYHHHGKNMIDWLMDTSLGANAEWVSVNHTKVNAVGAEASLAVNLGEALPRQDVLKTLALSYNYISQDKDLEQGMVSQYALEYLRHKLACSLGLQPLRNVGADLHFRWQDRVGAYTDFSGQAHNYRPYGLLDLRVKYDRQRYAFYVDVNNALCNRHYVDYGNVKQPGLWVVVGAKYKIL